MSFSEMDSGYGQQWKESKMEPVLDPNEVMELLASGDPKRIEDFMVRVYEEKVTPLILEFISRDLSEATQEEIKSVIRAQHEYTTTLLKLIEAKNS